MSRPCTVFLAWLAICTLCACRKNEIQFYEIPKETHAAPSAEGLPPGHPPSGSVGPGITWKTPDGWIEGDSQPAARVNFHIHREVGHLPGEVVVLDFPPHAAQLLDFTRLLSNQLEIQIEAEQTERDELETFTAGEIEYSIIRLTSELPFIEGKHKRSVLAAVLQMPGRIWFFNLTGAESVVNAENDSFFKFLSSIEFTAESAVAITGNMAGQSLPGGSFSDSENPQWTVPEGWELGRVSQMRRGSFQARGENGEFVDISVTTFPGDVGGILANINRWRGQIGLGPISAGMVDAVVKNLQVDEKQCQIVDLMGIVPPPGKDLPQRSLVGTFSHEGNSWFIKMSGDAPLVESQENNFMQFLSSVRF